MTRKLVDPVITNAVSKAILQALKVQASTEVRIESVNAEDRASGAGADIAAVLGMASETLAGTIVLRMPARTFLGVINKMLGEQFTEINSEIADAAGEILNIIYGLARPVINQAGNSFLPAIPSVMRGSDIVLSHTGAQCFSELHCISEHGPFYVEITITPVGGKK